MNLKSGGDLVLQRNYNSSMGKKHIVKPAGSLELSSSFIDSGHDRQLSVKALPRIASRSLRKQRKNWRLKIVNEFAGQYEDSFDNVKTRSKLLHRKMATYLWRKYADYVHTKWERMILWNMVEPYMRPKSFKPLVTIYIAGFYTGLIGSAITEQLYKVFFIYLFISCSCLSDYGEVLGGSSGGSSASDEAKVLFWTLESNEGRGSNQSVKAIAKSCSGFSFKIFLPVYDISPLYKY
ncbi:hypothetical protein FEM48_Zijuj08G0009700 [Ziziphus jujuba var. spinosa]|uniref:Uncharacterized protein n=1 Tax=Ziziphus jujuba var. spinosa TaxID=714518 RepID=A0A978UW26_ZIZJJ|nr:hypothetical protein FEM48_Zijuj08G0009700 [Ziziphus jujuba var. spinosa]